MDWVALGHITLWVSFVVYLFFLVPQVVHNFRVKSVQGLSFPMHCILFLAFICDLGYGIGNHMEWQYCTVSVIGVLVLLIQHVQFRILSEGMVPYYLLISVVYLVLLGVVLISLGIWSLGQGFYAGLGFVSMIGWLIYALPQIKKNYDRKSTKGLSILFIILGLLASTCDGISAYTLDWGLPNKLGAPLGVLFKTIILTQFMLYAEE